MRGRAGGLHLYAIHPELQIGPLALLAASPFAGLPGISSAWAAGVALPLRAGAILVALGSLARPRMHPLPSSCCWGAPLFLPVWGQLSHRRRARRRGHGR